MASNRVSLSKNISIGGVAITGEVILTVDNVDPTYVTLDAGEAGTLSTRTSASQGTLTLDISHGITTGQTVDLFWDGGIRRGMVVGTVSGASVPLTSSGAGDDLPAQDTEIVVCGVSYADVDFDGDTCQALVAYAKDGRASIEIQDDSDVAIADCSFDLAAGQVVDTALVTNPLAGVLVGRVAMSNGTTEENTVLAAFARNNVS